MSRRETPLNGYAPLFAEEYRQGASAKDIARRYGCSDSTVTEWLKRQDVHLRTRIENEALRIAKVRAMMTRPDIPTQELVRGYESGLTLRMLADRYACSKQAIGTRLANAGVHLRTRTEAMALYVARDVDAQTSLAARAIKARAVGILAAPITKQRRQYKVGAFEQDLAQALIIAGLQPVPQLAVDRYNVDLAVAPFAIEIHHSESHPNRTRLVAPRVKRLADLGWHTIYVWRYPKWPFAAGRVAEQCIAIMQEIGADPTTPRQHRVLASDGHALPTRRANTDENSFVPPPGNVRDADS